MLLAQGIGRPDNVNSKIEHIFVLALENRSFDHLFGYSGLAGVTAPDSALGMSSGALDPAAVDPPHEYEDVQLQIGGNPPMSGFARQPYGAVSMAGFGAQGAAVLRALAAEYLLFDNWYAALPGPTWPNRFFFHAASSGGLDNSPSSMTSLAGESVDSLSFDFQHGTIFQQLEAAGRKWRVYHDDLFPQVLAIKHMIDPFRLNTEHFSWLRGPGVDNFKNDLDNGYDVDYTFIEPNYGLAQGGFQHGNCQHPLGTLAAGEEFIRYIYQTISSSKVWPSSLLLITYDEHGGFFDRVAPPPAMPPGDDARNHDRAQHPADCGFDRLGVRVPAIAISPWIQAGGLASRIFGNARFDHTAIISTVRDCFQLPQPLTARDAATPSFGAACSLETPRTDIPEIPAQAPSDASAQIPTPAESLAVEPAAATLAQAPDHSIEAFARIAASVDLAMAQADATPSIGSTHPLFAAPLGAPPTTPTGPTAGTESAPAPAFALPHTRRARLTDYMRKVAERRNRRGRR